MAEPHDNANSGRSRRPDSISDHFSAKAERYSELDIFSEEEYYRPLFTAAAPAPGERALDLACGAGLLALMLARVVDRVAGCDVTAEMLKRAEAAAARAGLGNVSFIEAEASRLPFEDEVFDLVTCRTAFHHFPDPLAALAEVVRVLRPGGRFALEDVFGPEDAGLSHDREEIEKALDPFHVRAYSIKALEGLLTRAGFSIRSSSHPETRHLPLEIILRLENITEPGERERLEALLRQNIGRELGGFRVDEADGRLMMKWETVVIVAEK